MSPWETWGFCSLSRIFVYACLLSSHVSIDMTFICIRLNRIEWISYNKLFWVHCAGMSFDDDVMMWWCGIHMGHRLNKSYGIVGFKACNELTIFFYTVVNWEYVKLWTSGWMTRFSGDMTTPSSSSSPPLSSQIITIYLCSWVHAQFCSVQSAVGVESAVRNKMAFPEGIYLLIQS